MFSRRRVATLSAVVLLGTTLSACGSEDDGSAGSGSSGGAEAGFPATVQTKFGKVTVEKAPKRVVALGWGDAETALALGVQPVGQSDWLDFGGDGVGPWAKGKYTKSPTKIETLKPSYEKVAALEPDVILDVNSSGDADRYKRLSAIAPTIGVPKGGEAYLSTMKQQVTMIATALGKKAEGQQALKQVESKFAATRKEHPEFRGKTVSTSAYTSEGWGAYVKSSSRVTFLQRMGFRPSPKIDKLKAEGFSAPVSREQLSVLDADLMVVFPIYKPATEVTSQPLFKKLPAVKDGRAVVFGDEDDDVRTALSANTVLSVPFALDKSAPRFSKLLKK